MALALNGFFKNLNVEHFFLAFEDHFLINFVNTDIFQKAESIMNNDHTVGKVRLLPKYKSCNYLKTYNCDFYYAEESISTFLTTSLRPSIWNKKLFINLLNNKAVITPHKFETINLNSNFGMKVLVPKDINPIFPDLDAMRFGKPNDQALSPGKIVYDYYQLELQSEDLEVFKNIKDTWENGIQHK
mgnify:CR=1 FL=1